MLGSGEYPQKLQEKIKRIANVTVNVVLSQGNILNLIRRYKENCGDVDVIIDLWKFIVTDPSPEGPLTPTILTLLSSRNNHSDRVVGRNPQLVQIASKILERMLKCKGGGKREGKKNTKEVKEKRGGKRKTSYQPHDIQKKKQVTRANTNRLLREMMARDRNTKETLSKQRTSLKEFSKKSLDFFALDKTLSLDESISGKKSSMQGISKSNSLAADMFKTSKADISISNLVDTQINKGISIEGVENNTATEGMLATEGSTNEMGVSNIGLTS